MSTVQGAQFQLPPWDPYQENVGILGMQGTGKTTLAKQLLDRVPRIPRWIWSPQRPMDHYGEFGEPVNDIGELKRGAYVYTGEFGERTFDQFCHAAMRQYNLLLVIDDVHEYVKKQQIPENFARLINSGRNRGVCSIFLTPSPNIVHNNVLQSCKHIFAFKMGLESQVKWLATQFYGPDAYVLLPSHLRRIQPSIGTQYDTLPDHSYLYRRHTDTTNTLFVPGHAAIEGREAAEPILAEGQEVKPEGEPEEPKEDLEKNEIAEGQAV